MKRFTLLAGLSGLVGHSLAEYPVAGTCHDSVARCFVSHHAEAAAYCSSLPVVTETVTTSVLSSTCSSSASLTTSVVASSYPTKPKFACAAKCHRPSRYLSACACVGVPQQTTTTTVTYVVITTEPVSSSTSSLTTSPVSSYEITSTSTSSTESETTTSSTTSETTATETTISETTTSETTTSTTITSETTTSETITSTTTTSETTTSSVSTTTTTTPAGPPVTDEASYVDAVLRHHNVHRSNHSAVALTWSPSLASSAQQIADKCVFQHDNSVDDGNYGQNIAPGYPFTEIRRAITLDWYNAEVNNYNQYGETNTDYSSFTQWGSFSQVVWKGTTQVGCATADCSAKGGLVNTGGVPPYFTVCNYFPPGNFVGQFDQNIGAPLGMPSVDETY